jgi:hypothetical protein
MLHCTEHVRQNSGIPTTPFTQFFTTMNAFLLLMVGLASFLLLVLALFALSSCLGDEIRAAWSGRERYVPTTFGQQYARSMGHGGNQGGWEQIEMEDLMDESYKHRD